MNYTLRIKNYELGILRFAFLNLLTGHSERSEESLNICHSEEQSDEESLSLSQIPFKKESRLHERSFAYGSE